MSDTTIPTHALRALLEETDKLHTRAAAAFPVISARRQPVHTVYGGAHLFRANVASKLGAAALAALREHAPDGPALAAAMGLDEAIAARIHPRVVQKLEREPIEDIRIDFEDGFGSRTDEEEDRYASAAAADVAAAMAAGSLPPSVGIRVRPFDAEWKPRAVRTLDRFLTTLLQASGGTLPRNFVITLPKITAPEQVAGFALALDAFEYWRQIDSGTLRVELMIETPAAIFAPDGTIALPRLVEAGGGRVVAAHFGPYDYTAACHITAAAQHLRHPACDFARQVMQVALAGTAIWLSDGPTTVMPIGPHRAAPGRPLDADERAANTRAVHRAWRVQVEDVRHSLATGFYQGWDLHPAQLPARYAAAYSFFLEGLEPAAERLRAFVAKAAQATLVGNAFDDAATAQGLLNYFVRAVGCGAITEQEATELTGLTIDELRGRSFPAITASRRPS